MTSLMVLSLWGDFAHGAEEHTKEILEERIQHLEGMVKTLTNKIDELTQQQGVTIAQSIETLANVPETAQEQAVQLTQEELELLNHSDVVEGAATIDQPMTSENVHADNTVVSLPDQDTVSKTTDEQSATIGQNQLEQPENRSPDYVQVESAQETESTHSTFARDSDALTQKQSAQEIETKQERHAQTQTQTQETSQTQNKKTLRQLPNGPVQEMYEYSRSLMSQGKFQDAEEAFKAMIEHHPQDPLVVNAKYWLGETYYARQDFTKASFAFAEAYKHYRAIKKNSKDDAAIKQALVKAPEALLKLSLCLKQVGRHAHARSTLSQLEKEFPHLPQNLARMKEQLKRSLPVVKS